MVNTAHAFVTHIFAAYRASFHAPYCFCAFRRADVAYACRSKVLLNVIAYVGDRRWCTPFFYLAHANVIHLQLRCASGDPARRAICVEKTLPRGSAQHHSGRDGVEHLLTAATHCAHIGKYGRRDFSKRMANGKLQRSVTASAMVYRGGLACSWTV